MDFYGRAVLVITKFTALQETCSKSSFYYWIWFSRKNRKKAKKTLRETSYLLLLGSWRIQLSSASLIGIFEELLKSAQFSGVIEEFKCHLVSPIRIPLNFWKESYNISLIGIIRLFCLKVHTYVWNYPVHTIFCM